MKLLVVLILIPILSFNAFPQNVEKNIDVSLDDPQMSLKYLKGAHLIFDCFDNHWVCTTSPQRDSCVEQREKAIDRNQLNLPCAYWKSFSSVDTCVEEQVSLINKGMQFSFCLHENSKRHFISF